MLIRVFSWDWKEQAPIDAIAAAVEEVFDPKLGAPALTGYDTGGDSYCTIVSGGSLAGEDLDELVELYYEGDAELFTEAGALRHEPEADRKFEASDNRFASDWLASAGLKFEDTALDGSELAQERRGFALAASIVGTTVLVDAETINVTTLKLLNSSESEAVKRGYLTALGALSEAWKQVETGAGL